MKQATWFHIWSWLAANRFAAMGLLFTVGGAVAAVGSAVILVRFLHAHMPITREFTPNELAYGIVVPHLFILFGFALAGYGVFLLRRHDVAFFLMLAGRRPRLRH